MLAAHRSQMDGRINKVSSSGSVAAAAWQEHLHARGINSSSTTAGSNGTACVYLWRT